MPTGYALHLGLNRVDPAAYGGWPGTLNACVNDAVAMQRIAKDRGFSPGAMLLDDRATAGDLLTALRDYAAQAVPGDLVLVTRSGHGGEIPDGMGGKRQTWVLYDRQVLDTEIHAALAAFRQGVRLLIVSDACHSETDDRDMPEFTEKVIPREVAHADYAQRRDMYDSLLVGSGGVQASLHHLSACKDSQTALDGETNGAFTTALLRVYGDGYAGSYPQFAAAIQSRMADAGYVQIPQFNRDGLHDAAFLQSSPFEV